MTKGCVHFGVARAFSAPIERASSSTSKNARATTMFPKHSKGRIVVARNSLCPAWTLALGLVCLESFLFRVGCYKDAPRSVLGIESKHQNIINGGILCLKPTSPATCYLKYALILLVGRVNDFVLVASAPNHGRTNTTYPQTGNGP